MGVDRVTVSISLRFVHAYQAATQLDALGDATRRAIFERLASGPLAVVDIARTLPVSRPAVSQHLKVLKDARLVMDRAEGARRVYQVDPQGLAAIRDYFGAFWTDALDAFRRAAEETQGHGDRTPLRTPSNDRKQSKRNKKNRKHKERRK
jgi:DNA-binding transcriptional ArsR family regulator